jgi:hypothetical protein
VPLQSIPQALEPSEKIQSGGIKDEEHASLALTMLGTYIPRSAMNLVSIA